MQGKIIKGIAGFYYVHVVNSGLYECKAKGIFRNSNQKPFVGDNVEIVILDEEKKLGNITELFPRKNELIRPAVVNIDQALIIFALTQPEPNFNLLDRFLISMERQGVETIICFNKKDLATKEQIKRCYETYEKSGFTTITTCLKTREGIEEIDKVLKNKTTVLAGPSGVGKSSLLNILIPNAKMEIGTLSEKIKRGKHTTRHSEIFHLEGDTYIFDTPGFTSLLLPDLEKEDLRNYYFEFNPYENKCRFNGCVHINEPECSVKLALQQGVINPIRYSNYKGLYEELKEKEQRRY